MINIEQLLLTVLCLHDKDQNTLIEQSLHNKYSNRAVTCRSHITLLERCVNCMAIIDIGTCIGKDLLLGIGIGIFCIGGTLVFMMYVTTFSIFVIGFY